MAGEQDGRRRLSALFGVLVMVVSVTGAPVGAETLSGGTAQAGNVGTAGVLVNDAIIYNGTDSTVEVAYDGGTADPSNLEVVLLDGNQNLIASNASLAASSGVAKLTVPAGIPADLSVTAILADTSTSPSTQLGSDAATFTVKTLQYAPWVNRTNATHDPTTETTLDVKYNATGQVGSAGDLAVTFTDGGGQTVAANASLTATEGVAEVTVPAGTFSGDAGIAVELKDANKGRTLALDSFTLKASGGGGDTAAPEISNVKFTNNSGQMYISFESNESLGGSESDVTVTVTAPNDATYTFGRTTFTETGSGTYTYELAVSQAFVDGAGTYTAEVNDAVDPAGNNGGTNGAGSGLTASVDYKSGGGGGGDTAAPEISNVQFTNQSGDMYVTFQSNETLGADASDISVSVGGPNGKTYAFDGSDFTETGSGPYTYELSTQQAFDDGQGTYSAAVLDAVDPAGNNGGMNGGATGLTASVSAGGSGGGGGDTAAPDVTNVQFKNVSGYMYVTFESNETLGASTTDVLVEVTGPGTGTYVFDRDDFTEKGSGPYTYELAVTQQFTDGGGTYTAEVNDALDPAGNNGGTNGVGSGLTASVVASGNGGGGGGGSDTAPPNITGVDVSRGFNGNLSVRFTSNESLGSDAGDVTVTVDGPKTTDAYTFDRDDFAARYTGSGYEYSLQVDQPFSEGDGYYNATVDVAKDPAGNDGGGPDLNDSFMFIEQVVNSSSVSIVSGPGDEGKISLDAYYSSGLLQIQVKNSSQGYELQQAGLTKDTELKLTMEVKSKKPRALIGNARAVNWTRTQNADGNWTITITGTPSETDYYFPYPKEWTGDLRATTHREVSMSLASDTLAAWPADRRDSLSGIVFMTDAQSFAPPEYNASGPNPKIEFDVSAPHFNKSGQLNYGFAEVYLPQSLLNYWGVSGSAIAGQYNGESRSTRLTNVKDGGVQASVDVHYSSGTAAFTVDSTAPAAAAGSDVTVEAGSSVRFDGTSSTDNREIDTYEWDFDGDGKTEATGATPSTSFLSPGTHTVELTVTDPAGNADTDTLTVTVEDTTAPTVNVGSDRTVEAGNAVRFDASGSTDVVGVTSYEWDLDGDGKTEATGATPSKTWTSTGTKTATVTVSDAAGNDASATVTVTVEDTTAPTASVGSDRSITVGDSVSFDGSGSMDVVGVTSYEWDVDGDGRTEATGATPTYTFDSAGTFTVTLTVADAAGNTDTATLTVDVSERSDGGDDGSGGDGGTPTVTTTEEPTTTEASTTTAEPTTTEEPTSTTPTTEAPTAPPETEERTTATATTPPETEDGGSTTTAGDDDPSTTAAGDDDQSTTAAEDGDATTTEGQEPVDTATESGSGSTPGFGVAVALLAVLAAAALAGRRDE